MAKKRSTRRKKRKIDWPATRRMLSSVGVVAGLVALAVGLTLGVNVLRRSAAASMSSGGEYEAVRVTFDWPALAGRDGGTWLPEGDQRELTRAAERAAAGADPLSPSPLRRVSAVLAETGWFELAPTVRVVAPGVLRVEGEWRKPAAVVRWRGRDHLISMEAKPMPPVYRPGGANRPVILGCRLGPVTEPDGRSRYEQTWPGQDVRAGLDLLAVLWREELIGQVAGIDVGRYADGVLEIVTTHGTRVVWGSPPDDWTPGEPSVQERVERLRGLIERTGRIDGGQERIEIHRARVEIDRTGD